MSNSYVISGLMAKRAELAGAIIELERQADLIRADMEHIDAALRLFSPEMDPTTIRPKPRLRPRLAGFAVGDMAKRCREALRAAGPDGIKVGPIVDRAMADTGQDDPKMRYEMTRRFLRKLNALAKDGEVMKKGIGTEAVWSVAALSRALAAPEAS